MNKKWSDLFTENVVQIKDDMKTMQKTVSDTKQSTAVNADRSARRNNLVIYNFPEDDKDTKSRDKEFINELVNDFVHSANDYDLGKVAAWYGENYLSLNVKQTVDMIFHNSRKKLCLGDLSTCVTGSLISRVGFYRFLGLISLSNCTSSFNQ